MRQLKKIAIFSFLLAASIHTHAQCPGGDGKTIRVKIVDAEDTLKPVKCNVDVTCRKNGEAWSDDDVDYIEISANCAGVDYLIVTPPIIYDGLYRYKCDNIKNNQLVLTRKKKKDELLQRFEDKANHPIKR